VQTKLTLRTEDDLIKKAKQLARCRGKSLSKMVSDYFNHITSKKSSHDSNLQTNVKSLYGSLADTNINESSYEDHLEEKYL
jgi:hypothetical protein